MGGGGRGGAAAAAFVEHVPEDVFFEGMPPPTADNGEGERSEQACDVVDTNEDALPIPTHSTRSTPPSHTGSTGSTIYITNIPTACSSDDVRGLFDVYGRVDHVDVCVDAETGQPRGAAFVTFAAAGGARTAVDEMDGIEWAGQSVACKVLDDESV